MDHKGMKKLSLWIPLEVHNQLKKAAVDHNASITQLVQRLIQKYLIDKNQHG